VISRRFAQMMGGDIHLHSELGRGSTFTVRCRGPVGVRAFVLVARLRDAFPASAPAALPLVLVVDDEKATRELIARGLEKEGFRLVAAASGEEALQLARERKPDVISLDVLMPGMDGWMVLRALKADPLTAPIPVVMVSMLDDRDIGHALGASDYLTKPFDRQKLVAALRRYRRDGTQRPVLVVEDDAPTREVIKRALERDGWAVSEADNGRRGLQSVARHVPDLIVLDLMMPEMDGFEFVAELRKSESGRKIPWWWSRRRRSPKRTSGGSTATCGRAAQGLVLARGALPGAAPRPRSGRRR
jgi:CheY-like chemotaxis protein